MKASNDNEPELTEINYENLNGFFSIARVNEILDACESFQHGPKLVKQDSK